MKIAQRRQVLVICVLVAGLAAWGYAGLNWWRNDRNRVIVPHPVVDTAHADVPSVLPVLADIDLLRPVELSPELTSDEEAAAERIGRLVEIAHEEWSQVALDGKSSAPATREIMEQYNAWIRALYRDSFQRCADANASWRDEAAKWLDDYVAKGLEQEHRAALRETGQRLVDGGCEDWLIRYCLFRCHDDVDQPEQAARAVRILQPLDSLADSGYPPAITYRIYLAHAEAMSHLALGQPVGLKQAIDEFAAAISKPMSEDDRRFYAVRLRSELRGLFGRYQGQFVGQLEAAPEADRWFVRLIRGIWHIERAWELRGGGYASTVTEEGWSGFGAHLQKARVLLLQCWDEHPDCPEAATELIRATMGIGGIADEGPRFWFDEAVQAQFDIRGAYDSLRWALRPRWGGSHEELLAFGRECLATERFDTDVPWQFHLALKEIGSEIDDRRDVYRLDGVYEDYQKLLKGYRDQGDATPKLARRWDSRAACVAWLAGRNDAAKEILQRLSDEVDVEAFNDFDTSLGEVRRGLYGLAERPALASAPFSPGVEFVCIASRGHTVLAGSGFSGAHIADTQQGCETVATLAPAPGQAFRGYCLSPDGTTLVTVPMSFDNQADTPSVWLWDIASQTKLCEWTVPGGAFLAAFSPDGKHVAVGGISGLVTVWDVSSNPPIMATQVTGHSIFVRGLSFSRDGARLVTVGGDGTVIVWDVSRGPSKFELTRKNSIAVGPFGDRLGSISLSPDGQKLLVGGEKVVKWDLATGEKLLTVSGICGDFAPDGRRFVTGGGKLGTEASIWDAETGNELLKLRGGHTYEISIAVYSNDGRRILTGEASPNNIDEPGFVRCWDAESGEEVFDLSGLK